MFCQPLFFSPSSSHCGTRTLSKISWFTLQPPMVRIGRTVSPGLSRGTRNRLMPAYLLGALGSVRAATMMVSASCAPLVKIFSPFRIHSPPASSARRRSAAASDPASGSVSAQAPVSSPRAMRGRKWRFCSSLPKAITDWPTNTTDMRQRDSGAKRYSSSSLKMDTCRLSRPWPPYSRGHCMPTQPRSASRA